MKKAILTESGAKRIGYPELAGKRVEYDRITDDMFGNRPLATADNVYYHGKLICGVLSTVDDPEDIDDGLPRGLILLDQ